MLYFGEPDALKAQLVVMTMLSECLADSLLLYFGEPDALKAQLVVMIMLSECLADSLLFDVKLLIPIFVTLTIIMSTDLFSTYGDLLDRTARKVKQYAQRRFNAENYDITVDQWLILRNLNQHNDLNQSQLAEITDKDHPTLTRIIDLLCKKGLTERRIHPADRRSFNIHLTDLGKHHVAEWSPKMAEIRMKAWENLTEADYQNLKRILDTIYKNLDGVRPEGTDKG